MKRTEKRLPRLYVRDDLAAGAPAGLDGKQSNYLSNVMRLRAGDDVLVFNGRDGEWRAVLRSANRKGAILEVSGLMRPQSPPPDLWYGFAPLKSARLDYIVQKATEMGAATIQPVLTEHTQVARVNIERMAANAIEASEQCEMLFVPEIAAPIGLEDLIERWPALHSERVLIFADEGENAASPVEKLAALTGRQVGVLIGPEGGFSAAERAHLRRASFCVPISLGPRILRADTAGVAALALIQAIIGDWR